MRCGLLQLWADAIAGLVAGAGDGIRRRAAGCIERFRQLVGQMPEAELSQCSLRDLAGQLNCSERHFSRLFREEFGVPFRARQIELRLQHARQLLTNSDAKIINVAYDSGYRHLGLFNVMFKKRFGMTPSEWRQQNLRKNHSAPTRKNLPKFSGPRCGILLVLLRLEFYFTCPAHRRIQESLSPATNASRQPRLRATPLLTLTSGPMQSKATRCFPRTF